MLAQWTLLLVHDAGRQGAAGDGPGRRAPFRSRGEAKRFVCREKRNVSFSGGKRRNVSFSGNVFASVSSKQGQRPFAAIGLPHLRDERYGTIELTISRPFDHFAGQRTSASHPLLHLTPLTSFAVSPPPPLAIMYLSYFCY